MSVVASACYEQTSPWLEINLRLFSRPYYYKLPNKSSCKAQFVQRLVRWRFKSLKLCVSVIPSRNLDLQVDDVNDVWKLMEASLKVKLPLKLGVPESFWVILLKNCNYRSWYVCSDEDDWSRMVWFLIEGEDDDKLCVRWRRKSTCNGAKEATLN